MKSKRINWIDSSRGLAILLLIAVHYVGALESRNIISNEQLLVIQSFLRVATPYFILIFGFTYFITQKNRIFFVRDALNTVFRMRRKLLYVILGRQVIVLINSQRFESISDNLFEILTYQQLSPTGEILTFYFFAMICAPFFVVLMNRISSIAFSLGLFSAYSISYFIGSEFIDLGGNNLFRLFFYDVYPFFPMFCLSAFGMLLAKLYINIATDNKKLECFGMLAVLFIVIGLLCLLFSSSQPIYDLAKAKYKSPPHPIYIFTYVGITIFVNIILITAFEFIKNTRLIELSLGLIGRNSLLAYVLHYCLFLGTPISLVLFNNQAPLYEVLGFILILVIIFVLIYFRDSLKSKKI
tara:strand:- start:4191 stop:5252 length:1062 start_codon:yes stop_codon:yes gene_type:complete